MDNLGLRVINISLVGSRYSLQTGLKIPGCSIAYLSDGNKIIAGEGFCKGITGLLDYVDSLKKGINTSIFRKRIEVWVATGKMPTEKEVMS